MKYLKLFNESVSEYYEEASGREYNQVFDKHCDYSSDRTLISNSDKIFLSRSISKGYKIEFGNFYDGIEPPKFNAIYYTTDRIFYPNDDSTAFQIRKDKWYDRTELMVTGFITSDDYYYIRDYKTGKGYKCDQVDGAIEFLKTKGLSK